MSHDHRIGATPPGLAEAMDAVLAGDIGLLLSYFRKAQVVVAEVCREMVLVVAEEEWGGSGHIAPLGETRAPPCIVFRDRVLLGEMQCYELGHVNYGRLCSGNRAIS